MFLGIISFLDGRRNSLKTCANDRDRILRKIISFIRSLINKFINILINYHFHCSISSDNMYDVISILVAVNEYRAYNSLIKSAESIHIRSSRTEN